MCVCAPAQLGDKVDVDNVTSSCICPRNTWQQCIQRSGHFQVVEGS